MEFNIHVSEFSLHILANVLVSWEGQKKQNKLFYEHLEEVRNEIQNMFLTRSKIFSS